MIQKRIARLHQKSVAIGHIVAQLLVGGAARLGCIAQLEIGILYLRGEREAWEQVSERAALLVKVAAVLIIIEIHPLIAKSCREL